MTDKSARIAQKLYITLRALVVAGWVGLVLFAVGVAVYDWQINKKALNCYNSTVPHQFTIPAGSEAEWTKQVSESLEGLKESSRAALQIMVKEACPDLLEINSIDYPSESNPTVIVTIKFWDPRSNYDFRRQLQDVAAAMIVPIFFLGALYGIRRWVMWLLM